MPPTRAAATMTPSGRFSSSHFRISACRMRSSARRSAVSTSQRSDASRRTSAAPTIPRCPATKMRRPMRSNGSAPAACSRVMKRLSTLRGNSIMPIGAFPLQPHLRAVAIDHLPDEILKARLVAPAELLARFARVTEEEVDFGRTKVAWIDLDQNLPGLGVNAGLLDARATPGDPTAHMTKGALNKLAHRMFLAGGQHIVIRLILLQHHPHAFHVVAGMAPIAFGIQVAKINPVLQTKLDGGNCAGDLASHEGFAAGRTLVIEQNAVGRVKAVSFAIVHGDPIGVELGGRVRGARVEGR